MAYRFKAEDRSVEISVRRIARGQVDKALAAIAGKDADKATHEVRKACKKVRALVRLIRPVFPAYKIENARFRNIARGLSQSRDAKVMLDTFDLLAADASDETDREAIASFREKVSTQLVDAAPAAGGNEPLDHANKLLEDARSAIDSWTLDECDWDAIGAGLNKILRQARKAARKARKKPSGEHYHELRKLMKHHWYHTRLLAPIWPEMMRPRAAVLSDLADKLGLHHDVCVFEERLRNQSPDEDSAAAAETMLSLAAARGQALERDMQLPTARLLAQSPDGVVDHWHALWNVWRSAPASASGKD